MIFRKFQQYDVTREKSHYPGVELNSAATLRPCDVLWRHYFLVCGYARTCIVQKCVKLLQNTSGEFTGTMVKQVMNNSFAL